MLCRAAGKVGDLDLAEIDAPKPGPGEVRVAVEVCGVTYPDLLLVQGRYQFVPDYPFAPGCEFAGRIDALGADVTVFATGDRVICSNVRGGGMAEAKHSRHLPDDFPADDAVAVLGNYGTSLHALTTRGALQTGETLLVLGASDGVGLAAVQLGKALGARVVAGVSSEEKKALVLEHGADAAVLYPRNPAAGDARALAALFKEAVGPGGADVVFDPVGGPYSGAALRAIAWKGRFLVVGFPSGIARIPLNLPLLKGCQIVGVFLGGAMEREPDRHAAEMEQLIALYRDGQLRPHVSARHGLEDAGHALETLAGRGALGKILIDIGGAG